MLDHELPRMFSVMAEEDETEPSSPTGIIRIDATQHVQVVIAKPEFENLLQNAAEELNAEDQLWIDVPPPPGMPRGIYKRTVLRGSPEAVDVILALLSVKFGLSLQPFD